MSKSSPTTRLSPLLKWPGGKRQLVKHLLPILPEDYGTYFEPFLGGGALFFSLTPTSSILGDKNSDLINCYRHVRDHPDGVIEILSRYRNSKEDYYAIRSERPTKGVERAARFIYLSNLSFNGIYRQNLKGEFNVPYGFRSEREHCNSDAIFDASRALQGATLRTGDFRECLRAAKADDLIYLDPPYTVAHNANGFIKYNAKIFSWNDQVRLARLAATLDAKGCSVIVSNADHPSITSLYPGFKKKTISRGSVISASKDFRGVITESIFLSTSLTLGQS